MPLATSTWRVSAGILAVQLAPRPGMAVIRSRLERSAAGASVCASAAFIGVTSGSRSGAALAVSPWKVRPGPTVNQPAARASRVAVPTVSLRVRRAFGLRRRRPAARPWVCSASLRGAGAEAERRCEAARWEPDMRTILPDPGDAVEPGPCDEPVSIRARKRFSGAGKHPR